MADQIKISIEGFANFRGIITTNISIKNVYEIKGLFEAIELYEKNYADSKDIWVTLKFINSNGEKQFRRLKKEDCFNLESFSKAIDRVRPGKSEHGYDYSEIDDDIYEVSLDFAQIYTSRSFGLSNFLFCNVLETPNLDGESCLFESIKSRVLDWDSKTKDYKIAGDILKDIFKRKLIVYKDLPDKCPIFNMKPKNRQNNGCDYVMHKGKEYVIFNVLKLRVEYENDITDYDEKETVEIVSSNGHVAILNAVNKNNYYCDKKGVMYFLDKEKDEMVKVISKYEILKEEDKKTGGSILISYDFETAFSVSDIGLLKGYNIAYEIDYSNLKEKKRKSNRAGIISTPKNFDCAKKFAKILKDIILNDNKILLIGFNNNGFDDLLLMKELNELDLLNDVIYTPENGKILNMDFGFDCSVFDVCRYITSTSLDKAGKEFDTKNKKISGELKPDMIEIQEYFEEFSDLSNYFHDSDCKHKEYQIEFNYSIRDDVDLDTILVQNSKCKCQKNYRLMKYNLLDTLTTLELYIILEKLCQPILDKTFGENSRRFRDIKTIGSFINCLFEKDYAFQRLPHMGDAMKNSKVKPSYKKEKILQMCEGLSKRIKVRNYIQYKYYKKIRRSLIGGRVQCFKNEDKFYKDTTFKKKYCLVDFKSMYPYVMLNRYYPCGEISKNITLEDCEKYGYIGYYCCDINQEAMSKTVIPKRLKTDVLDYDYKGLQKQIWINSIDLLCLKRNKGVISNITDGFGFTEKIWGGELFKCLLPFKEGKEEEDRKKSIGLPNSPAKRQLFKIFLNSLSGKVIERIHTKLAKYVKNNEDMKKAEFRAVDKSGIELAFQIDNFKGLVVTDIPEEEAFKKYHKPTYLGTLIYSYAREHLYENIIRDYPLFYCDTDSAILLKEDYEILMNKILWEPSNTKINEKIDTESNELFDGISLLNGPKRKQDRPIMGSEFGQLELDEIGFFNGLATIEAKNYICLKKDEKEIITVVKKGFKGIGMNKDIFLNSDAVKQINKEFMDNNELMGRYGSKVENFLLYSGNKLIANSKLKEQQKLFGFNYIYNTNPDKIIDKINNILEIIEELYNNNQVYILCGSLKKKKILLDKEKIKKIQNIEIRQHYCIKVVYANSQLIKIKENKQYDKNIKRYNKVILEFEKLMIN